MNAYLSVVGFPAMDGSCTQGCTINPCVFASCAVVPSFTIAYESSIHDHAGVIIVAFQISICNAPTPGGKKKYIVPARCLTCFEVQNNQTSTVEALLGRQYPAYMNLQPIFHILIWVVFVMALNEATYSMMSELPINEPSLRFNGHFFSRALVYWHSA